MVLEGLSYNRFNKGLNLRADQEGRSKQMDVFTLATNRKSNREFAKREVSADKLQEQKD